MGDGPGGVGGVNGTFKGQKVEEYLDLAVGGTSPTKMYLNFLSRADTAIGDAASDINKRICSYIRTTFPLPGPRRLGVLPFDFVGNTGDGQGCLEDAIVEQNPFKADTSYTYSSAVRAPQRFKIQVSVTDDGGSTATASRTHPSPRAPATRSWPAGTGARRPTPSRCASRRP